MERNTAASEPSQDDRPEVLLFTDGACIENPGPGGWAFLLRHPASGRQMEGSGGEHATTNSRMEITAVIRGLEALALPSRIELFSDSQYVVNAIGTWMARWKAFGWRKSPKAKSLVKNADLWRRLDEAATRHQVTALWVRGHNGHPENEECDRLANAAAARVASVPPPARPGDAAQAVGSLFDGKARPEPTSLCTLLALGTAVLLRWRRRIA